MKLLTQTEIVTQNDIEEDFSFTYPGATRQDCSVTISSGTVRGHYKRPGRDTDSERAEKYVTNLKVRSMATEHSMRKHKYLVQAGQ